MNVYTQASVLFLARCAIKHLLQIAILLSMNVYTLVSVGFLARYAINHSLTNAVLSDMNMYTQALVDCLDEAVQELVR